jgi:outer membrane protein, heavy metal efflux system
MTIRSSPCVSKKPIIGRCFASALLLLASGGRADEPAPLNEHDALERVLARAPLADALEGSIDAESGRARAAGAWSNPELGYSREQTFGPSGTAEDYLTLSQSFDLGAHRSLRASAGAARVQAARQEAGAARLALATETRVRFYELVYRRERVAVLERWGAHVGEALQVVLKREKRGDVAAYDRRRIQREESVAAGRLGTERAALGRGRARLAALLGQDVPAIVTGPLLPDADPAPLAQLRATGSQRPDLLALDQLGKAARDERAAAERWWLPELRVDAGWKGVDLGATRSDGYVFGVALALPLWDRSAGQAQTAVGEARSAGGRRALLESELAGELAGARARGGRVAGRGHRLPCPDCSSCQRAGAHGQRGLRRRRAGTARAPRCLPRPRRRRTRRPRHGAPSASSSTRARPAHWGRLAMRPVRNAFCLLHANYVRDAVGHITQKIETIDTLTTSYGYAYDRLLVLPRNMPTV